MITTEDVMRYDPELSEEEASGVAATVNKYLKQMIVVKAAEFACSSEGKKRGSGAMRRLNQTVADYTEKGGEQ